MSYDAREQRELIKRIRASEGFRKAPTLSNLLQFLFDHRNTPLMAKEIEETHFGFPSQHTRHNPAHTREAVSKTKTLVERYSKKAFDEKWICSLPDSKRGEGYQLVLTRRRKRTAADLFWAPHLERAEDVIVVCGDHLFLLDEAANSVVRYLDFNTDSSKEETLTALKKIAHRDAYNAGLEPIHNVYLAAGEVEAHERLQKWFHGRAGVLVERMVGRDTPDRDIYRRSPILMGRPGTNRFIRKIMASSASAHLRYRIHSPLGAIKITAPDESEEAALSKFPLTKDGVLGPIPEWESIFGIFARLPNPGGQGHVTIISADYRAKVIAQIVETLTDDRLAEDILAKMKWPENTELPESFELLFRIPHAPGNLEAEGQPELLCWRPSPEAP